MQYGNVLKVVIKYKIDRQDSQDSVTHSPVRACKDIHEEFTQYMNNIMCNRTLQHKSGDMRLEV